MTLRQPKFELGQSVYLKDDVDYYIACHNKKYDTYGNPRPRSFTIITRLIEECEGGIQFFLSLIHI